jgi:hypothetical protein
MSTVDGQSAPGGSPSREPAGQADYMLREQSGQEVPV